MYPMSSPGVRLAVHHPAVMEQPVAEVDLQERACAADRSIHRDRDLRLRRPVQAARGGAFDGDVGNVRAVEFDEQAQDDPAQSGSAATRPKLNVQRRVVVAVREIDAAPCIEP